MNPVTETPKSSPIEAEAALRAFKAVGDPNRLRIVRLLTAGPFHVAELTEILGVGQSTVSRNLKILNQAGLVQVQRTGTWAWYSLRREDDAEGRTFEAQLLRLLEHLPGVNGEAEAVEAVLAKRRSATSDFFRRTAPEWDSVRDRVLGPSRHLDRVLERVGTGETVVDLGTGTGVLLDRLAPSFARVIGVDASEEMLEVARRRAEEHGLENTDLRLGRLEHLPLSDGEANAMVANFVLQHVSDPAGAIREIRRGLVPGARFVFADLAEYTRDSLRETLGAQWPGFRRDDLRAWLHAAGFRNVRLEEIEPELTEHPTVLLGEAIAA